MPDVKDLDSVFLHTIGNNMRQSLMQQFPRTLINALAPAMGESFERPDGLMNLGNGGIRQMRVALFQIFVNAF